MKKISIAALVFSVFAGPALAADTNTSQPQVVREFVANAGAADWTLDLGWTWNDGVLTHFPGTTGAAIQTTMPGMTVGKLYRIQVDIKGCTHGSVMISLGGSSFSKCDENAGYSLTREVTDPSALLTFTATRDFDGSIPSIRIVELGDEMVDQASWVVPDGWSQDGSVFTHAPGSDSSLEQPVAVVRGRTYRLYFGVVAAARQNADADVVDAQADQRSPSLFDQPGNYEYEVVATEDGGRLTFSPRSMREADGSFGGLLRLISLREITSDPVVSHDAGTGSSGSR